EASSANRRGPGASGRSRSYAARSMPAIRIIDANRRARAGAFVDARLRELRLWRGRLIAPVLSAAGRRGLHQNGDTRTPGAPPLPRQPSCPAGAGDPLSVVPWKVRQSAAGRLVAEAAVWSPVVVVVEP